MFGFPMLQKSFKFFCSEKTQFEEWDDDDDTRGRVGSGKKSEKRREGHERRVMGQ
jgi:hypothetical protein